MTLLPFDPRLMWEPKSEATRSGGTRFWEKGRVYENMFGRSRRGRLPAPWAGKLHQESGSGTKIHIPDLMLRNREPVRQ